MSLPVGRPTSAWQGENEIDDGFAFIVCGKYIHAVLLEA